MYYTYTFGLKIKHIFFLEQHDLQTHIDEHL